MDFFSCFFFFFLFCWLTSFVFLQITFWRFRNVIPDTAVALELPIILDIVHLSSGELCLLGLLWCFRVWGLHLHSSLSFFCWRPHWDPCLPSLPLALTPHHELPLLNTCYILGAKLGSFQWSFYFLLSYYYPHLTYMEPRLWEVNLPKAIPNSSAGKESTCNAGDPGSIPKWGRSTGEGIGYPPQNFWASLVAQTVKNTPAMQET